MIRKTVLAALIVAGITAATPEQDLKKAYFKASKGPLSKAQLPELIAALNGDETVVNDDTAAAQTPAASTKPTKTQKEPKPANEPKPARVAETPEAALARLKTDPATSAKWARVHSVLEMGKRGPVKIRIVCDDTNEDGSARHRDIKVQDLFQVKFSLEYQSTKKKAAAAATLAKMEAKKANEATPVAA